MGHKNTPDTEITFIIDSHTHMPAHTHTHTYMYAVHILHACMNAHTHMHTACLHSCLWVNQSHQIFTDCDNKMTVPPLSQDHTVHPVPGRAGSRSPGESAQLPDNDRGPDGPRRLQCLSSG